MKFEDVLVEVNGFGRFQKLILSLSFLGRFTLPCHFMLTNFIAAVPSHHCDLSGLDTEGVFENLTAEQRLAVSIPARGDGTPSSCLMFPEPQFHLLVNSSNATTLPAGPCQNGWVFDNSTFRSTLASEWDLVCENKGLNKATATIFFIGVMFGAVTYGILSDRYGRRPMLLVSYVSGMGFALISAFSTSYIMFAVLRFLTGFSITGIIIVSSVLNVEWVDVGSRKLVGVVDSLSWTFGGVFFPLIAYGFRDWRWLTIAVTLPLIPAIISWRWFPESARWLIASGQLKKAQFYLQKSAKMNQREVTSSTKAENLAFIVVKEKGSRTYSYLDLVRTPKMRKLAMLTGMTWFGVAATSYGIGFNITGFGVDFYLTQFIYAVTELPAKLSVYYLLEKFGRRKTEAGSLLITGVCLGINIFISKVVLYSSELYPTVIRQNGIGYNSFMARVGVASAPLILLLEEVWTNLAQVVLCSITILTSLVASFLPETRGKCLPETIEDIEGKREDPVGSPSDGRNKMNYEEPTFISDTCTD
ncbi:solute carrier family 22 member 7-like isoform X2 [Alosa alosa]|uniref:solute carrier family 22 member 7-like isoform X2 n=1 Tax=Alosa alosa TaxID=278164 RepID=UPI00201538B3|nr:solute carrier family 22 member 7-like isoform X2 [Alosa alosa]